MARIRVIQQQAWLNAGPSSWRCRSAQAVLFDTKPLGFVQLVLK